MTLNLLPVPWRQTVLDETVPYGKFAETISKELGPEEYRILVTKREKTIEAGSQQALRYAHTTLEQIRFQCGDKLPLMFIEDKPAVEYRSFMLDSCRHFIPFEELKKMVKTAAAFKFNHFHWHLSDDQGFRMESLCFPKLHEEGSVRKGDNFGGAGIKEEQGGYYTQAQIKELVGFASSLGIEITPEFDFPGHVSALLHCYPQLGCGGRPVEVKTCQGIFDDVLCLGNEKAFEFVCQLFDEIIGLFPGEYIHIGGDEAPKKHWENCPACQERMKKLGVRGGRALQGDFENRLIEYLSKKGKKVIVWNDAVNGGNLDSRAIVQKWMPDKGPHLKMHAEEGGKILYSPVHHAYCDYPYSLQSLRDIYNLETSPKEYSKLKENPVMGTECLIWTEFVRDEKRLEEYAWPRFIASAEAGWLGVHKETYRAFKKRLKVLLPYLESFDVHVMPEQEWTPGPVLWIKRTFEFAKNFASK